MSCKRFFKNGIVLRQSLVAGLICILAEALLISAPLQDDEGIYTAAQAERGKEIYTAKCVTCHGANLMGAAAIPLVGPQFARRWGGDRPVVGPMEWRGSDFTVDDLFFVIRTTMPPGESRSLSLEEHVAVLTYILQQNGFPAGSTSLEPDSPRLTETNLGFQPSVLRARREPAPPYIKGEGQTTPLAEIGPSQNVLNSAQLSTRDWLYHTHDYSGARFVQLDQINSDNADGLQVSCAFQVGEISNFQTGPIVHRGTMYVTTVHLTVALDASNCRPKWRHTWETKDTEVWFNNRGVAIKDGYVVRGTSDGYLIALNAENGKLVWARKLANPAVGETFTMAPLIYEDMVLIGPAGSENAISGWVGAFRLSDGSEIWKFKTVPGADEGGSETWGNPKGIKLGGGAVWTPFSLDTDKEELYVAVTNPAPDLPIGLRPGKNLYTNSLVALDIRTGTLRWYKQLVPNDSHDWDLTQVSPLFKAMINGKEARLVATVGKDGILRTLDRDGHEVLYETPVTTIKNYNVPVSPEGTLACPGVLGGVEWNGPAFNPGTNMLYVGAVDWCTTFWAAETVRYLPGKNYMGGTVQRTKENQGWITAIDASSGEVQWKYRSPRPIVAAVTTTSGNIVFSGELTGDFIVLDAKSGETLYRFNTGGPIGGGIITYQLGGRQYVAVMSGRPSRFWVDQNPGAPTVFLFALP